MSDLIVDAHDVVESKSHPTSDEVLGHYLKIGGCGPSVVGGVTIRVTITVTIGRRIRP
jgi:hypothetical protein